jgi:hypothetical protein
MHWTSTRGKHSTPHRDPAEPPRRRGHTRNGHGTYANERPDHQDDLAGAAFLGV